MSGTQKPLRFAKPPMPQLGPKVARFGSIMRLYPAFWPLAALGAVILLAGCIGEPQTYYAAKPVVLQRHAVARALKKSALAPPAPTLTPVLSAPILSDPVLSPPVLSADEKQQLFQEFQASQRLKDPIPTAPGATAPGEAP